MGYQPCFYGQTPIYGGTYPAMPNAMGPIQAAQPAAAPPDDRLLVQGEVAATSWPVTANGFVRLWDSTANVFYEKRADAQGKPLPLEIYDYKRRGGDPPAAANAAGYEDRLSAIEKRLEAMEADRAAENQKEEK